MRAFLRGLIRFVFVLAIIGTVVIWFLSAPDRLSPSTLAGLSGDAERGAVVFAAAGCASCHTAPGAEPADAPVLSGGQRFVSEFGTFIAPNITNDAAQGIGGWTDAQVVEAVTRGISPEGTHYYPVFPYDAYAKAAPQDILDLVAHLRSLPVSDAASLPHDVEFPFSIRRAVGLWKLLFRSDDWVVAGALTPEQTRGRYLVEALGHCGECHTPRNALGGLERSNWLGGAPNPAGEGRIPNITPAVLTWPEAAIAQYLFSGLTPDFDSAGGEMAAVIRNTSKLPDADRAAIAAYLKVVPPVAAGAPAAPAPEPTPEPVPASE